MKDQTAQPGDTVELKDKETGFYDAETSFKIVREEKAKLGSAIGKRTHEAIVSGALLIVSDKSKTDDSEKPAPKK